MKKLKVLYVHGLCGTKNGNTAKALRSACEENNCLLYTFDVPPMPKLAI